MKFFTGLLAFPAILATVTAQTTVVDIVYDDVSLINQRVIELTATTQAYKGGFFEEAPFLIDFGPVYLATRKGYYDSLGLPNPLTESDAQRLIDHVNETLAINNPRAVNVVKSKKPQFDAAGTSPVVKDGLELLLFAHLSFSDEVAKRITDETQRAQGQSVIDVITVALKDGIAYFSS